MRDPLTLRGIDTGYRLSTISATFGLVAEGHDPWLALGDFIDDWRRAQDDQRELMLAAPIDAQGLTTRELRQWAALFVGVADLLCWNNEPRLAPAAWLNDDGFCLDEPWFVLPGEKMRVWQAEHSPAPLRLRNVFVDPSVVSRV